MSFSPETTTPFLTKNAPKIGVFKAWLHWLLPDTEPNLSTHIARDIGLSQHDLAVMHHQWPSETQRHPHL